MLIAEIGCNHRGEIDTALEMISVAADYCKADVVKFQKRTPRKLLTPEQYDAPHPNPAFSYGATYGEHRERLEFDTDTHRRLLAHCAEHGIAYSTSVWDIDAAQEMAALEPALLKIPSAANNNHAMLSWLFDHFGGQIHISTGMTTRVEEEALVDLAERHGRCGDLVIYACTSGYPVAFEDVCLFEITRLIEAYGDRVAAIGFSGHHLGIATDIAALALGATWFERHFTLDRTWKGTDHAASLEPDGLRKLARDLGNVRKTLRHKPSEILPVEEEQRAKLKHRPT